MTSRIDYNNPKDSGAFGLPFHYELVSDKKRVTTFKKAIQLTCKNKRVLGSGTGSAIFSILAAKAGAKKVFAVEMDSNIFKFAELNVEKSDFSNVIKLIQKDIRKVTLEDLDNEKVDVVIAENLSTWQVTEPEIPIMNYVNKILIKDRGISLPNVIYNYLELAHSQFRFENAIDLKTYYFEFTGIHKPINLSRKIIFSKVNLREINSTIIDHTVGVKVIKNGILNSLRLTSPLQLFDNITFDSSDCLMPPVIVPLENDVSVSKGDNVLVNIRYRCNTNWDTVVCIAKVEYK